MLFLQRERKYPSFSRRSSRFAVCAPRFRWRSLFWRTRAREMWARIFRGYRYVCSARTHCGDNCPAWAGGQLCHIAADIFARRLIGTNRTLHRKRTEDLRRNQQQFRRSFNPRTVLDGISGRPYILVQRALVWVRWYWCDQMEGWEWQAVHDPKILHEGLERWSIEPDWPAIRDGSPACHGS